MKKATEEIKEPTTGDTRKGIISRDKMGFYDPAETEKKFVQKESKKRKLSAEPTPREEKRQDQE